MPVEVGGRGAGAESAHAAALEEAEAMRLPGIEALAKTRTLEKI